MRVRRFKKVLIADKEPYWRDFSKRILEKKGLHVLAASDYDQLLSTLEEEKPDLVVLGFAAIGERERQIIGEVLRLRSDRHVLVLSTSLPLETMRELFVLGASDVAGKPFAEAELLKLVESELGEERTRSSYQEVKQGRLRNG